MDKLQLEGQRFGKLVVIRFDSMKNGYSQWLCECKCGNKKIIRGASLTKGKTESCEVCINR